MKKIYRIITAALVATAVLSSCTKEVTGEKQNPDPAVGSLRTIEVSFITQTKSALSDDGVTPIFQDGDRIMVSNKSQCEECTIEMSRFSGKLSFTTSLEGDYLKAVYPSKVAKMEGNDLIGFNVPSNPTGKFKDANIAWAEYYGEGKMWFSNCTAVLKFYADASIGVKEITMSVGEDECLADGNFDENGLPMEGGSPNVIHVTPVSGERVCYVAVRPGTFQELEVVSATATQKVENDEGMVTRYFSPASLNKGSLYDVFIPYYIEVNVGDETSPEIQRWGYCNVGAFLPEETGKYFAWGDTDGYKWLVKSDEGFFEDNHPFSWETCPFNDGISVYSQEVFEAHKATVCPNGTLIADYDAAYLSWGGKWRMPTNEEIEKLYSIITPLEDVSEDGLRIKGTSLFFPLTGYGFVQDRPNREWTDSGIYWTSSLNATAEALAYCFNFTREQESVKYIGDSFDRPQGLPIRPIYKITGLTVESYQKGKDL